MADLAEIKTITVQGGAVDAYKLLRGMKSKGRRGTRKAKQEGGEECMDEGYVAPRRTTRMTMRKMDGGAEEAPVIVTAPGTMAQNAKEMGNLPALTAAKEAGTLPNTPSLTPTATATEQLTKLAPAPAGAPLDLPHQAGGKQLILAPRKTKGKVLLAPPSKKAKTNRGCTRKIRVQLSNMKKRITTAKVIHRDSKEKSIEEIRKLLEEAKLVKPAKEGKSVPEDILRNIYKDYLILRNKAL